MARAPIYLDYNATALVRPEVREVVLEMLAAPMNPSSVHGFGREAKKQLENARKTIAQAVSAFSNEVIFCGSGTEANSMALKGVAGRMVIVSAVEHSSVLVHGERQVAVDENGLVDVGALDAMLAGCGPALVSVMLANNETGVIQPMGEVAAICKKHAALLHVDAVQGLGKIPVDFGALGADMLSIAGHKMGAGVGAAALIVQQKLPILPFLKGGGQELNRRAGTENVAAIAGFAKAVELVDLSHMKKLRGWLDGLETQLSHTVIFGKNTGRLPNVSCLGLRGLSQEVALMKLDLAGFAVSAGSACSSGRMEPSHVLKAMGVEVKLAASAIRISGGWATTQHDIQAIGEYLAGLGL